MKKSSPYVITSDDESTSSRSSPRSPLPTLTAKESILLSRLNNASSQDDDEIGRKKITNLLSRHTIEGSTLNTGADVSPLMQAAIKGNVACCEELMNVGSNPNLTTSYGWSSIHFAAALGKDKCLSALLHHGSIPIVPDAPDDSGFCPIHLAAMGGHTGSIDVLVRAGHSLKVVSDELATPLHLAAQEGKLFTVHRLCKLNVSIDQDDQAGSTSLTISCRKGNNNIAQVLLDNGADVNHLTKTGSTGLSVACANGRLDIARTLLERGALVRPQDLLAAAEAGHAAIITIMLPQIEIVSDSELKGIRIRRIPNAIGGIQMPRLSLSPALHIASKKGHCAAATVLLENGAEVNSFGMLKCFQVENLFIVHYTSCNYR